MCCSHQTHPLLPRLRLRALFSWCRNMIRTGARLHCNPNCLILQHYHTELRRKNVRFINVMTKCEGKTMCRQCFRCLGTFSLYLQTFNSLEVSIAALILKYLTLLAAQDCNNPGFQAIWGKTQKTFETPTGLDFWSAVCLCGSRLETGKVKESSESGWAEL